MGTKGRRNIKKPKKEVKNTPSEIGLDGKGRIDNVELLGVRKGKRSR